MKQVSNSTATSRRTGLAVLPMFLSAVVLVSLSEASTITVTSVLDTTGNASICTLRDAITAANTNHTAGGCAAGSPFPAMDTIQIPLSRQFCLLNGCTIVLTGPLPAVSEDVTITGNGTVVPTISGNNLYRIFDLQGVTVNLTRLSMINGRVSALLGVDGGAAVRTSPSGTTLTVSDASFSANNATGGNGTGGAIFAPASGTVLVLDKVTFAGNSAARVGGALYHEGLTLIVTNSTFSGNVVTLGDGGALVAYNDVRLTNVTLSGNSAPGGVGGGLYWSGSTASLSLNNVTITGNSAGVRGGGASLGSSPPAAAVASNSIIAGNSSGSQNIAPDCEGPIFSAGYNLLGDDKDCAGLTNGVNGDKVGTDASPLNPLLGPLNNNGGATRTHALLAGSPAIDAGNPLTPGGGGFAVCAATDQRGIARPVGAQCDMGAYEAPIDDADRDGVVDSLDNCVNVANGPYLPDAGGNSQRDTNGDGYGNVCDADFNGDGVVNINDLNRLKARLNIVPVVDVDADLDGNGAVNINDFNRLKSFLGKPPGPSGLHPNCPPTCP